MELQNLMFEILCVSFALVIVSFLAILFLPFEIVMLTLYHCNSEMHNLFLDDRDPQKRG